MVWTEERIELLRKFWANGLSASQCADALKCGLSRSAVIGKVHRLHLAPRATRSGRPKGGNHRRPAHQRPTFGVYKRATIKPPSSFELPEPKKIAFIDLRSGQCRWPYGDPCKPDFCFCGHDVLTGFSYCACHARVAYTTAPTPDRAEREIKYRQTIR